jgi:hypothetical protein
MHALGPATRHVYLSVTTFALVTASLGGHLTEHGLGVASANAAAQACRGRCLDPHPGQFRSWYGERNNCWVQVWRQWPEGCTHYQMFNSCQNSWDVHPNGAPRVYWTCCVH